MARFLEVSLARAGADSMVTPREMLRDYMTILNILLQNPRVTFEEILESSGANAQAEKISEVKSDATTSKQGIYTANDIEF